MTDWFGLDDRVKSAEAGLDLEMPGTDGKKHCLYGGAVETGQTGRTRDP